MRLTRHARNRLRWIQRAHPGVSEQELRRALIAGRTLGYDERGNRRVRVLVSVDSTEIVLVIDDRARLVITMWAK